MTKSTTVEREGAGVATATVHASRSGGVRQLFSYSQPVRNPIVAAWSAKPGKLGRKLQAMFSTGTRGRAVQSPHLTARLLDKKVALWPP